MSMTSSNLFRPYPAPKHNDLSLDWAPSVVQDLGLRCESCHRPMAVLKKYGTTPKGIRVTVITCVNPMCSNRKREGWSFDRAGSKYKPVFW